MPSANPIRSVAIVGGGTAGWSAAALMATMLRGTGVGVTIVESADIPTVGVGEATIPPIFEFLANLAIDPADFVRETGATFKLAIEFRDWLHRGHRYWHPFGNFGVTIDRRPFQHHFHAHGGNLADFAPAIALAEAGKFAAAPPGAGFPAGGVTHALHFDAGLVAAYLRKVAEVRGAVRLERTVRAAPLDARGHIAALVFDNDERLEADLYIDCSGFRGLLIEGALAAGYDEWTGHLPCDRAVAMPSEHVPARTPYTISTAREAGWQWRIPLQHRVGNGYVYSSAHISDDEAAARLTASLDAPKLADPRFLRFTAGHRRAFWKGNCLAIGLSSGFLEPLESTSIHLIITGLNRLLDYFPDRNFAPELAAAYNRETTAEFAHIRDFLMLHYVPNRRRGEAFWDQCRATPLPDSLAERIAMYQNSGRVVQRGATLFSDLSWFWVFHGMGLTPATHDPLVAASDPAAITDVMAQMARAMAAFIAAAPTHDTALSQFMRAHAPLRAVAHR